MKGGGEIYLREALEEIQEEFRDDPMVVTSEYSSPLSKLIGAIHDEREVWVEWGDISYGDATVPATHVFFLDEDGYMQRDGSGLSVVSASDYLSLNL